MIKIQLLFYLFQLLLCFPELGQVEGGDLLSLLDLLLVRLDLLLKLRCQLGHALLRSRKIKKVYALYLPEIICKVGLCYLHFNNFKLK